MSPQDQYKAETGKDIWKIPNHTHTDEYVQWIKNYVKTSNDTPAKLVRDFINKTLKQQQ